MFIFILYFRDSLPSGDTLVIFTYSVYTLVCVHSVCHHSRTVADGFGFLLQHAAMNSGGLSPLGLERASLSVCVLETGRWRDRERHARVCVCVCVAIVLLFAVMSPRPHGKRSLYYY